MRVTLLAVPLSLLFSILPVNAQAVMRHYQLNIPRQPLNTALKDFALQTGLQVARFSDRVDGAAIVGPVSGDLSAADALKSLLEPKGLSYKVINERTIVVIKAGSDAGAKAPTTSSSDDHKGSNEEGAAGASPADGFRLAKTDQGAAAELSSARQESAAAAAGTAALEEIVVTAQKRTERLLDVPQSVSVLSADELVKLGATQFRDLAATVPGLSFSTAGAGNTQITLRGVTVGYDISPTVGIYVDEVPYGASTVFSLGAQFALDAGLFGLDHIEVLRGPQGTLYGASTMGGLIKYVTKRPDTTQFGGDMRAGLSSTEQGGINYNIAAAANLPIVADKVALRASAFQSHDGGFIDNVALNRSDVNRSNVNGGRLDLLMTPSSALSIRLTAFLQNITRDGEGTADYRYTGEPTYGALDQYRALNEPFDQRFRIVSAKVSYDLAWADLTSISSYQTIHTNFLADISAFYVPAFQALGPFSAIGLPNNLGTHKYTQEVRLASKSQHRPLQWVLGGFYNHESSTVSERFIERDLAGNPSPLNIFSYYAPTLFTESAVFGDLTWRFNSMFEVTGGLRYARNRQEFTQVGSGLIGFSLPTHASSEDVFTYLANARYHISDHATAYVRYATGYRPGGPNVVTIAGGADTFGADRLRSYEAGFKVETLDGNFAAELAGYDIHWSDIQIGAIRNNFQIYTNAPGGATIHGAELSLTVRPVTGFTATGALAFQQAYMNQADADLGARKGERLPNVPRFTADVGADYRLPISRLAPTVGASLRHVGDRNVSFDGSAGYPQYRLPGYTTVDLRGGLMFGKVSTQIYVHNAADRRAQQSVIFPQFGPRVAITQPRTIGITATTQF